MIEIPIELYRKFEQQETELADLKRLVREMEKLFKESLGVIQFLCLNVNTNAYLQWTISQRKEVNDIQINIPEILNRFTSPGDNEE